MVGATIQAGYRDSHGLAHDNIMPRFHRGECRE